MTSTRTRHLVGSLTATLHLAAFLPCLLAPLVAPPLAVQLMRAGWVCLAVLAVHLHRRQPLLALAVPGVTVLLGVLALVLGGEVLGWQG